MANSSVLSLIFLVAIISTTTDLLLISARKYRRPPPSPFSIQPPYKHFLPTSYQPPPATPSSHLPPISPAPPASLAEIKRQQLNNIIDALIGAGGFTGWINLLSSTNPSSLPLTATALVPSNDAISQFSTANATRMNFDPFIVPYHIVPQRLSFSDLQQLPIHTRLPTLIPSKYIIVTNSSRVNFTLDDSLVTHPDILVNDAVSVHGINTVLDYTVHGGNDGVFSPLPPPLVAGALMPKPVLAPPLQNDIKPVVPPLSPAKENTIHVNFSVWWVFLVYLLFLRLYRMLHRYSYFVLLYVLLD